MKVLNFGSLNIDNVYAVKDIVKEGETVSSTSLHVYSGGKGLNQSIALRRAGIHVMQAGVIGTDGMFLKELLDEDEVDTRYIQEISNIKTGHAIIQINQEGENCILLYAGANHQITKEYIDEVLKDFSKGDVLSLQNEISELSYLIDVAHEKDMIIFFNPSPINDTIFEINLSHVNYLLLNEHEAKAIVKQDEIDVEESVEIIKGMYPNLKILLTLGKNGSVYYDKDTKIQQSAYPVKAVDTTGAGDTYTGYFIAGILRGLSIQETMVLASKASAIAVTKKGAAPSIPKYEEVENYKF